MTSSRTFAVTDAVTSAESLRHMMEIATGFRRGKREGRWVIETQFRRRPWKVVVEPLPEKHRLAVVTAYEVKKLV